MTLTLQNRKGYLETRKLAKLSGEFEAYDKAQADKYVPVLGATLLVLVGIAALAKWADQVNTGVSSPEQSATDASVRSDAASAIGPSNK